MRHLVKMMFIPLVGCIAIGLMFLFVIFGGRFDIVDEAGVEQSLHGSVIEDLGLVEARLGLTTDCDPHLYSPVCGHDGVTYDNACFAYRAGTATAHHGACQN